MLHVNGQRLLKFIFFCFYNLFFTCGMLAQQAKQYSFTRYHTGAGLASNYVNNLTQDHKRFIWLATVNGLQRYDGHKFVTFRNEAGNPLSLPSDNVAWVFADSQKKLWIATADNKVGIFNTEYFRYTNVPIRANINSTVYAPKSLFQTKAGKLVLFMGVYGIYTLGPGSDEFVPDTSIDIPKGWKLNDLVEDPVSGRYWMAADSGLAVFDPATRHLSYRKHNIDKNPFITAFENEKTAYEIYVEGNRIFFITWAPRARFPLLHYYDHKTRYLRVFNLCESLNLGYHELLGQLRQRNGRLWFYGLPFITEFTGGKNPFNPVRNQYNNEQSIKYDRVNNMFEDQEQNIWISTDNGVFLFNPDAQPFNSYYLVRPGDKELTEGPTQAILEFPNGNVWVGCWGLGLYAYDKNFNAVQLPPGLRKNSGSWYIWCMWQHRTSGVIWMGLQEGGMIVYDPAADKTEIFYPPIFEGRTIRKVTEDKEGNLWFGTQGGHVIKWDRRLAGNNVHKGYSVFHKKGLVHSIYTGRDGFVWVATLGTGLFKINPSDNSFAVYNSRGPEGQRLSADAPSDVVQYNDSLLLIANGTLDVLNTKTNRVTTISTHDQLPSNNVLCVQKDDNGLLWLGMINGLCRLNLERKIFIMYDRRDGITYDNFNVAGAFKLANGKLAFTNDHNFLVFDPSEMVQKDPPPDVKILDFKVANNPLRVDSLLKLKKITIDYNKASVSINFGTLSYLRKNKKVFYYQMDKIDDDWVLADEWHQAIYTYIPTGTYTFRVKSVNGYGIASNITSLAIYVKPPFWKTWWFYGIIFLMSIGLLYYIDKERIRRLLSLQQVRTQIAVNLHHDINTTLNNIHLLSEIAKIKADKDLVKSKEYIDQINNKSRRMIDAMDDMLWSIAPENDSMQKTLERMNEYAEGLRNNHGCSITLIVEEKVKSMKLDMKLRHEIFFIFKEALNNIIQHSNCTESIINIDLVNSTLYLKIHDNGNGFDVKTSQSNNGLREMMKRAEVLNAVLDIQSDKKGTSLILQVPVGGSR